MIDLNHSFLFFLSIMATKLLESTGDYLEREVDDMASSLQDSQSSFGDSMR